MSELYEKSLHKLELDQVLQLLAECAGSSEGKSACLRVYPSSDLDVVREMLAETSAASDLCTRKGNPSFTDVKDVGASLEHADRGGSLQCKELLAIAGVLRCARNIQAYVAEDDPETVLDPLFRMLTPNKYLEDKINKPIHRQQFAYTGHLATDLFLYPDTNAPNSHRHGQSY